MKKIVIYFSASGVTAKRAKELASVTGSDVKAIVPAQSYSPADLDWMDHKSRSYQENLDDAVRPALKQGTVDFAGYDRIYLGFLHQEAVACSQRSGHCKNNILSWISKQENY